MTLAKGPDPVKPMITFDNYVIPETVREVRRPKRRAPSASPVGAYFSNLPKRDGAARKLPTGYIVMGTFLLGVASALFFVRPSASVEVADLPAAPVTAQAENVVVQVEEPQFDLPQAQQPVEVAVAPVEEPAQAPAVAGPAQLERIVSASLQQDVTRQESADLITPSSGLSRSDAAQLSLAEILLGLTPQRASLSEVAAQEGEGYFDRGVLETLRENVLSGTYTVKTVERNGVERLCLRIPHAEVTQDQAADLLRDAAARGEIELPDALSTSDGDFDADTLIFNLVQTSLANDGTQAGAEAAREMRRRAFVASNAKTDKVDGERIYIVQPGDSLAYLSLQFYGQPSAYPRIYQANRATLRSPDYIQVGQRLIIPG